MIKRLKKFFSSRPPDAEKGKINFSFFDRFTFAHFMIGVAYAWAGFHFWLVLFLAIVWELIENPLKHHYPSLFPNASADTLKNAISDCIAVIAGWTCIRYQDQLFNSSLWNLGA